MTLGPLLQRLSSGSSGSGEVVEMELRELVDLIHQAAADPSIVALQGTFGQGFQFSVGGYAQLEEIRNAIRLFQQSHRIHTEPNLLDPSDHPNKSSSPPPAREPKYTFAYADTFGHPMDTGNKEYFLASEFQNIFLQDQGEINLFGLSMSKTFWGGFLDNYGIKAHVFKHGKYKNAPNTVTETQFTNEHYENTFSIIEDINQTIVDGIMSSRETATADLATELDERLWDYRMWRELYSHGVLPSTVAATLGLVDACTPIDVLDHLLEANKHDEVKANLQVVFGKALDLEKFRATEAMPLQTYRAVVAKRKKQEAYQWRILEFTNAWSEKSFLARGLFYLVGQKTTNPDHMEMFKDEVKARKETIAQVNIIGSINDKVAAATMAALKHAAKDKDVKCVILRVDSPGGSVTASEAIYQTCIHLGKPIVCSMGNVAASGGYYVAADCARIFASPTTITGSIGVFGVKLDLTDFASRYGVNVDHVTTGSNAAPSDPLQPMTLNIEKTFSRNVDRYYTHFKRIVSTGRHMSMDHVQSVAQGRVWTGEQAKEAGLIDEFGGLCRAIDHARNTYTAGSAQVVVYPKKVSFRERVENLLTANENGAISKKTMLMEIWNEVVVATAMSERGSSISTHGSSDTDVLRTAVSSILDKALQGSNTNTNLSGIMLTMDESDALKLLLKSASTLSDSFPPSFWG
uniref:Peptidase S49 domain-containing protein n=1 Tax=Attheya septentrionalis TaxID=420275 RepID=A0A7S2XK82_9STRA